MLGLLTNEIAGRLEVQNATTPDLPFLGNDIRYTEEQIIAHGKMTS